MKPLARRQLRIAILYLTLGLLVIAAAIVWAQPSNWDNWDIWWVFAAAFVVLEFSAVEVNDRLFQSSSIIVATTAGAYFALFPETSAFAAMVFMAALGPLVPADFKEKRWFQPTANFGQLVITAAAAGLTLDLTLARIPDPAASDLPLIALAGSAASLVYSVVNTLMVRLAVRSVYGSRNVMPWSRMPALVTSQLVMGLLGGLLGGALVIVDAPAVVALILIVYLIAHLSLSSYAQLREAHQSALRGFVKALEARDLYTRGHTERVAYFSQLIGESLKFTGTQLERLRWAALIHDLGKLAIPGELVAKRGRLTAQEFTAMRESARSVEEILGEVDFLRPMVSISGVHYIELDSFDRDTWTLEASIVAVADAFDAMTSTRSYRMAMTQAEAFAEMRVDESGRFLPDVVNALEGALARTGEVYGGPTVVVGGEPKAVSQVDHV